MASETTATRRRYGAELKTQVRAQCDAPGASVAKVAMAHGINANGVHRWRQLTREGRPTALALCGEFVPVTLGPARAESTADKDSTEPYRDLDVERLAAVGCDSLRRVAWR